MTRAAVAALPLLLLAPAPVAAQERGPVDHRASGTFDVQLTPAEPPAPGLAAMAMTKTFRGALTGKATGRMMSAGDPATGAAGYVALEVVTGTLDGRAGGFALQHSGTMQAGGQALSVQVVPGSGTGALAGIAGTMTIRVDGNSHAYELRYTLPR